MKLSLPAFVLVNVLGFASFFVAVEWAQGAVSVSALCPVPKLIGTRDTRIVSRAMHMCTDRKPCPVVIIKRGDRIEVTCKDKIKLEKSK